MIKGGPKIINDGLVLCLDAHDAKSYAGEPVTNMAYNIGISGLGSTWEAITSVPVSEGQTGPGANINFKKLNDNSLANTFLNSGGKIFRNYVNNPATSDNTSFNNNGGFKYASSINLTSGGASGYVIISFWCYLVTGYTGYGSSGLGNSYMQFNDSGGTYTGNGSRTFYVDGVSKSASETFNADTGRWKFVQIRFTKPANSTAIRNFYIYSDRNTQGEMYVCQLQIEDRSDSGFYQVPFVEGVSSRSATDGWVDISGNSNSGTLTNMIGTEASHYRDGQVIMPINNAYLDFDGTNDYLSIPQFDFTSTHSLEWWFNTDNLTEKYSGGGGYAGHMLCWGHSPSERIYLKTNGGITIYIHDSSSGASFDTSNFSATAGEWTHITATLDWISKSVKFYQNGVLKDTIDISSMGSWNYTGASNPYDYIDFGRNVNNNNIFYDGKLASIKIYNKILTAAEVLSNYNATKGRFS